MATSDPDDDLDDDLDDDEDKPEVSAKAGATAEKRRFGALLRADVDGKLRGAVVAVGATASFLRIFEASAAGLIGQHPGFYLGGHAALPAGKLQGVATLGVPVYFIDGPRVAAHGAVGARYSLNPRLAITLEAGVEYFFDVPPNYETLVFVPSLGVRWLVL